MMDTTPCSVCGSALQPDDRFCISCGTPIAQSCPHCGAELRPGSRFCAVCGSSLSPAVSQPSTPTTESPVAPPTAVTPAPPPLSSPQEERRLVTALFCDLVGFTPLAERLDAEEMRDIQAEYFGKMSEQIERYGGTVEKYAGDAVLALFGAPIAHEDDAERAVLCALGMQEAIEPVAAKARSRWEVEPAIRVGVNTGEVVSGVWHAGGREDVAVTGDAINTASRLQSAAEPGEVLVGTETMRLTRRRIRYGERRDVVLKGKAGTVAVYPALAVREQMGERWESRAVAPLIGRDREMLDLLDAWVRAQAGEGQLVTIVGDAGVGKSRLITELLQRIGAGAAMRVVRARSLSYGQEISLWLIADLLRSLFGIGEQEALDEVRTKLGVAVTGMLSASAEETQIEALDVLGEVLGLPPGTSRVDHAGAQIRRQSVIRSLRLLLGALSERAPTVIVLEDLHWLDEASQEVLTEILSDVPGLRLLVLAAQRPGWNAPWSQWGWTERMTLRPLRDEEAAVLAGAVLGGARLSPELERYVAERAGGNPFFVEEMLRALQEAGDLVQRDGQMWLVPGAAERLPTTLTEVLLARLDRLEGDARSMVQVASVIGRSFGVRLLALVMGRDTNELDAVLTALQRSEIAFPHRGADLEYVFKHVSMRDVAYNTLVSKRRQELHLQVARAIAELYPSDEYVEIIAYHYSRTEEHTEAAVWLERAGDRAAGVYAMEAAIANYEEAKRRLEQSGAVARTLARLDDKLGDTFLTAGRYDEALTALQRAVDVYSEERDLEAAGQATARMGITHRYRNTPQEGIALVQPMVELLQWSGPSRALASLYVALATLLFLTGRYREELEAAQKASELARAIGDDRLLGEAEERRGTALIILGEPEEGRRAIENALPLIEKGGDILVLWRAVANVGEAAKQSGDLAAARAYTERALEASERMGNPGQTAFVLGNLADIVFMLGEWQTAQEYLERALLVARDRPEDSINPFLTLGHLLLHQGDLAGATRYLGQAHDLAEKAGDRQQHEYAEAFLAEIALLEGRPEEARDRLEPLVEQEDAESTLLPPLVLAYLALDDLDRAEELAVTLLRRARELQRLMLPEALLAQGSVLLRRGCKEEAQQAFDEGREVARSLPYPYMEARILTEQGMIGGETGRPLLEQALAIFRRLGAIRDVERLEEALSRVA